jgi:hypothetical protein
MLTWLAKLLQSDKDISADLPTIVAAGDVRYATARLQRLKRKFVALGAQFPARPLVFFKPGTRAAFDVTDRRRMLIDEAHALLGVAEQMFKPFLLLPSLQAIHTLLDQAGHKLQVATDIGRQLEAMHRFDIGTWTGVPFDAHDSAATDHFRDWEYACASDAYYGVDGSADGGSDGGGGNGGDGGGDGSGGGGDGGGGGD